MTYTKETCKPCEGEGGNNDIMCLKCLGNGYIMISERHEPNKLINQKPHGTGANDRKF